MHSAIMLRPLAFGILCTIFHFAYGGISLSMPSATKTEGDELLVSCRDESGQPTEWVGPDRKNLGPKTHPKVGRASYGTWMLFYKLKLADAGVYTCVTPFSQENFTLSVEGTQRSSQGRHPSRTRPENRDRDDSRSGSSSSSSSSSSSREHYPTSTQHERPPMGTRGGYREDLVFKDTPPQQSTEENTNFTIKCEVTGKNTMVSWAREDGDSLDEQKFLQIADGLVVRNAQKEDSGIYICRAVQLKSGVVKEQRIEFNVEHKPYPVHGKQENVWGYEGGHINLTCQVYSNPAPEFLWYKKYHSSKKPIHDEIYTDHNTSVLILYFTDDTKKGTYVCQAKNSVGMTEIYYTIEKGEQPKEPKSIELRGRNHDFLDVGVIKNEEQYTMDGMEPNFYVFRYRHFEEDKWDEAAFPINDENSYILEHLEKGSEYEIKVAAKNLAGLSDFTYNSSYFSTLDEPSGSPTHLPSFIFIVFLQLLAIFYY